MKAIIQRVLSASVTVDKEVVSSIGKGVLVLAAVAAGDTEKEADTLANKVLRLKLWGDDGAMWKKNVTDIEGEVLCVSQFTLLAKTSKGNKPDFHRAAPGPEAKRLYEYFLQKVRAGYAAERVKDGRFQAMMEVALVNDGPVTFEISAEPKAAAELKAAGPKKTAEPKKATEPRKAAEPKKTAEPEKSASDAETAEQKAAISSVQ